MAAYVLSNVQLLLGSSTAAGDISGYTGEFDIGIEAAMQPSDNYGAYGYQCRIPGLTKASGNIKGNADFASGAIYSFIKGANAGVQSGLAIIPNGTAGVAGDACSFMRGRLSKASIANGAIGNTAKFDAQIDGDSAEIDGVIAATLASRGALTGTSVQLGAVSASQRLWAALYVTGAVGTNLAVTIESDNATGFPSAATAITFSTVSAAGWQFTSVAGPITDDWFRMKSTVGSSTFTYAVVMGIL